MTRDQPIADGQEAEAMTRVKTLARDHEEGKLMNCNFSVHHGGVPGSVVAGNVSGMQHSITMLPHRLDVTYMRLFQCVIT